MYTLDELIDTNPSITVSWRVGNSAVDISETRISVLNDTLLVFNPLGTSDSGSYECTVSIAAEEFVTVLDPQQGVPIEITVEGS